MSEIDVFAYLPRFAASRLVAWWTAKPDGKWCSSSPLAIGMVVGALRGAPPPRSQKLITECMRTREALLEQMHHEGARCCG